MRETNNGGDVDYWYDVETGLKNQANRGQRRPDRKSWPGIQLQRALAADINHYRGVHTRAEGYRRAWRATGRQRENLRVGRGGRWATLFQKLARRDRFFGRTWEHLPGFRERYSRTINVVSFRYFPLVAGKDKRDTHLEDIFMRPFFENNAEIAKEVAAVLTGRKPEDLEVYYCDRQRKSQKLVASDLLQKGFRLQDLASLFREPDSLWEKWRRISKARVPFLEIRNIDGLTVFQLSFLPVPRINPLVVGRLKVASKKGVPAVGGWIEVNWLDKPVKTDKVITLLKQVYEETKPNSAFGKKR